MMRALGLILPVIFPSWRFFDTIGPSPRIEVARLAGPDDAPAVWVALTVRPARRTWTDVLARLFWNPGGNADLYLTRCAERVLEDEAEAALRDLIAGAAARLRSKVGDTATGRAWFCLRILTVTREGNTAVTREAYRSAAVPLADTAAR